ncbi:MAG: MFS transporter [Dehalococcoidia bacterium]
MPYTSGIMETVPPATVAEPRKPIFYGWWIVGSGILIQVFSGALFGGFGTFIVPLEAEFGWNKTVFAGATSMRQIESGLLGPVQGWLIDRFGSRMMVRLGTVLFGLGFILMSQIDSILSFYLAFLIAAIGASLGGVQTLTVTVVNWFERKRATALGLVNSGWSIGGLLLPMIALAMSTVGWRQTMLVAGIAIIVFGVPLAQVIRNRPEDHGLLPDGADHRSQSAGRAALAVPDFTARQALRTSAFWLVAVGHAAALLVVSSVNIYLVSFLSQTYGFSLVAAATFVTALSATSLISQLGGGFLGDRFDKRLISAVCMLAHMSALLLLAYGGSIVAVAAFVVLHGAAWGIRGPLMPAIRADYFGRASFGMINGISSTVTMIGTVAGPLFVGITTDLLGSYQLGFTVLALLAGLGSLTFVFARKPRLPRGDLTPLTSRS